MRAGAVVVAGLLLLPGTGPGGGGALASQESTRPPALLTATASSPASSTAPVPAAATAATDVLQEVTVSAPELRYVAPTLHDRLGRIWAPVFINGRGPYRLVLDTGASHSAITAEVARDLGLMPISATGVLLRGVTGSAVVSVVRAESLTVGDLQLEEPQLPIVPDALGGAQVVLGVEGLAGKRIFIDFMHDEIRITHSHGTRADPGFITIPVQLDKRGLLRTQAYVGGVRTLVIIDTGGQVSVGNLALKQALLRSASDRGLQNVSIEGATDDIQPGQSHLMPPIALGPAMIRGSDLTFCDLHIFESWGLTQTPTLLIGMDTLGLLDVLIIDYRRQELQIRLRGHE